MHDPQLPAATDPRFAGVERLYGAQAFARVRDAHVCVIGLGGVGSWTVEALARSGVGRLTLVDLDEVCVSNVNRQLHATRETVGRSKADVMRARVESINDACEVTVREAFFTESTAESILAPGFDFVVDAIDSFKHKITLITHCRERAQPLIVCGSAGGRRDGAQVMIDDLARTHRDALLQIVRKRLRQQHGFPKKGTKKFGIPAVFTPEAPVYPAADGEVCAVKPVDSETGNRQSMRLSCEQGLGAATFVTGTMGFIAAGVVINRIAQPDA